MKQNTATLIAVATALTCGGFQTSLAFTEMLRGSSYGITALSAVSAFFVVIILGPGSLRLTRAIAVANYQDAQPEEIKPHLLSIAASQRAGEPIA